MSFFDSEIVQNEIESIMEMQKHIYMSSSRYMLMSSTERLEHIDQMQELLDKQRILHARMSLCKDPEAKQMLEKMRMTARTLGVSDDVSFDELFDNMQRIIQNMKRSIQIS